MVVEENPQDQAVALLDGGRPVEALEVLRAFRAQGHDGLMVRLIMARALLTAKDIAGAAEEALETALLYPDVAEAAIMAGNVLLVASRLPEAIGEFQRALRIAPENGDARFLLGKAWLEAGEAQKALDQFDRCSPDAPALADMRRQAERILAAARSDAKYVRYLFDDFSSNYDGHMLQRLHYRAPSALRSMFDLVGGGRSNLSILDLGCGTGLAGMAFRDLAASLTGIDLSPKMIDAAGKRGIYASLHIGDIEHAPTTDNTFDLLLAADTLVYLGDLSAVANEAYRVLKTDGMFLFTVEKKDGAGFDLGPKRRWRHSETYLQRLADEAGFGVVGFLSCSPRTEAGADVAGFAVALRKMKKNT